MTRTSHILIIGANFINKGAEAMLKTVQQEISKHHHTAVFYLICRDFEKQLAEENGFVPVYDESNEFKKRFDFLTGRVVGKLMKVFLNKEKPFVFHFPYQAIRKKVKQLDLVVDISGFAYADSWGKPLLDETINLFDFCKKNYRAKTCFLPQAWGSFQKPEVATAATEMLQKADRFYARDLVSQEFLAGLIKTERHNIPLMHDIVFAYEGSSIDQGRLLESVGYSKSGRPLIGISPNMRVYEKEAGEGADNSYMKILMAICKHCLTELKADILLIPNEIYPDGVSKSAKDDRFLCRMLYDSINAPDRCFIVDGYRSAEEIKAFIGQLDLLVSSRFHALIFGFLHAVPVMAISWSHKYKELFSLFELEDYVLEADAINDKAAINLLQKLFGEKKEVSTKIASTLGRLQVDVEEMFYEVALVAQPAVDKVPSE